MVIYRLPLFVEFLHKHYRDLYNHYVGRLIELFPSFQSGESNLQIVHDAADRVAEDELILQLWTRFQSTE